MMAPSRLTFLLSSFIIIPYHPKVKSLIYSRLASLLLALLPIHLVAAEPSAKILTPPDSLLLDGLPPIPSEVEEQVGRYTESRAADFLDWHPSKPEMLILTRFGDTNQVHLVTQPGGARTQLTFFSDRINDASFDPKAGAFFVFSKSAGGNEFNQNYRYDFANGEVTLLTDGKSRNSAPIWSHDGTRVAYTSTRRNGTDTDIYLEQPNDRKTDRMLAEVKGRRVGNHRLVAGPNHAPCA